jgi:hypothetical protein
MAYSYVPSAKALAFQRDLAAAIEARLADPALTGISGDVVVKSFSDVTAVKGAPLISVKDGSTVDALIRIEQVETIAKDILGLSQTVFTPHVAKLCINDDLGTTSELKLLAICGGECILRGVKLEVYNADPVEDATAFSGTPVIVFDSVQYPLMSTL